MLQALLILGSGVFFFALVGTLIIFFVAPEYALLKRIGVTLLGLGSYLFAVLSLRHYLKETPKIIISTSAITIKWLFHRREIPLLDIAGVGLKQKSPLFFVYMTFPVESTVIRSKQHGEIIIFDPYYENINSLKLTLEKIFEKINRGDVDVDVLANIKARPEVKELNPDDIRLERFKAYQGNWLLNLNSIFFFGFLIFSVVMFNVDRVGSFLFANGMIYGLVGYQSHYFCVSENYLQVRNNLWFWKRTTYRLADINEVILEIPGKLSQSARIVLNNYATSLNPAGSLRQQDWIEFMDDLEKKGVKVRDELYLKS